MTPVAPDLVGVAILGDGQGDYESRLAAFPALAKRLSSAPPASAVRGAGPLRQDVRSRTAGRVLLVGDASGYLDALTGEGIGQAIESGTAAAEAVLACGVRGPSAVAQAYAAKMAATLRREQVVAAIASRFVSRPAGAEVAVRAASAGRLGRSTSGRFLFEDIPRWAPFTPDAWPALLRSGEEPGPYASL